MNLPLNEMNILLHGHIAHIVPCIRLPFRGLDLIILCSTRPVSIQFYHYHLILVLYQSHLFNSLSCLLNAVSNYNYSGAKCELHHMKCANLTRPLSKGHLPLAMLSIPLLLHHFNKGIISTVNHIYLQSFDVI